MHIATFIYTFLVAEVIYMLQLMSSNSVLVVQITQHSRAAKYVMNGDGDKREEFHFHCRKLKYLG